MRVRKGVRVISVIGILLGFSLVMAIRSQNSITDLGGLPFVDKPIENLKEIEGLLNTRKDLENHKDELIEQARDYQAQIEAYEEDVSERLYKGEEIREQLGNARLLAGLTDIQGPGVEIYLNDRKKESIMLQDSQMYGLYIVHDSDMLNVVNELRAAGAEAISINGARILETSRISCGGPTINIGLEERFVPPFIIHAIGDPDALAGYFKREDSIYHVLTYWGLEFKITKKDNIEIPRYLGKTKNKYAKPVKEGE